jgi:hypothetical protein
MVKTDSVGNVEFSKVINDNAREYDQEILAGFQTSDGGYVLAGYSGDGAPEGYLALLIKVDGDGALQWSEKYQYPPDDHGAMAYTVIQAADGGYIVGGELINSIENNKASMHGCWIAKVTSVGGVVWSRSYANAVQTISSPKALRETPQGDILAVGAMHGNLTLAKFDSAGELLWNFEMDYNAIGNDLVLTEDGGCVIAASGITGGPSVIVKVDNVF